jgi:hypothetical protein
LEPLGVPARVIERVEEIATRIGAVGAVAAVVLCCGGRVILVACA